MHFNFVAGQVPILKLGSEAITACVTLALAATAVSLCVLYDIIVAFTGLIFVCCQVCRALTLTAHGNLQLEQIKIGAKPQRRAVILKTNTGMTWDIERWWSAQGRSSLKKGKRKEICSVTSVCWQATEGTIVIVTLL